MTSFYAVATRNTRVRVVFSEPMLRNASLVDASQYLVTDLAGDPVSVVSVAIEQIADAYSTALELGTELVDSRPYRVNILNSIVSEADETPLAVDTFIFQWMGSSLSAQIPIDQFSGEAVGGLYGIHNGLVFFSPALEAAAQNSTIEVEQVDVCSRAYDEYHIPPQSDVDRPLMTHGAGIVSTPTITRLNSTDVLWQPAVVRVGARFEMDLAFSESMPQPVDGPVTVTTVAWPPARIALLNSTGWKLFDNQGTPPRYFITADNLTPIVPLAPVVITL